MRRLFSFAYLILAALLLAFMAVSCPSGDADNPKISFSAEDNGIVSDGEDAFLNESDDAGMRIGQSFVVRFSLVPESATVDMLRFEYDKETVGIEILPDKRSIRITLLKKPAGEKSASIIAYPADPSSKTVVGKLNLKLYEKPVKKITIKESDADEPNVFVNEIDEGESVKLEYALEPEDTTDKDVKWAFYDELFTVDGARDSDAIRASDYLELDEKGIVTAKGVTPGYGSVGVCAWTVGEGGKRLVSNVVWFRVKSVSVQSVVVSGHNGSSVSNDDFWGWTNVSMKPNSVKWLKAEALPANASDRTVLWECDEYEDPSEKVVELVSEGDGVVKVVSGDRVGTNYVYAKSAAVPWIHRMCIVSVVEHEVESVEIDPSFGEVTIEQTLQLQAIVSPENTTDKSVSWKSTDESKAVVSQSGLVTGVGKGYVDIEASSTDGGKIGKCRIKVNPIYVSEIRLDADANTFKATETIQLKPTVLPDNATDKSLSFSSDSEEFAVVDDSGLITAVKMGNAVITATAKDGSGVTSEYAVTIEKTPVEEVRISDKGGEIVLERTRSLILKASVEPASATDKSIDWSSDASSTISVDQTGKVTALAASGSAVIRAASHDNPLKYDEIVVNAAELPVDKIMLAYTDRAFNIGDTDQLAVKSVIPAEVITTSVEYASDRPEVASVSDDGIIKANGKGNCTITCTVKDNCGNSKSESCHVSVERFVRFDFDSKGGLKTANSKRNWDGFMEYSTNLSDWRSWNGSEISIDEAGSIYLRGSGNSMLTGLWEDCDSPESDEKLSNEMRWVFETDDGGSVRVSGDMRDLLNYEDYDSIENLKDGCFRSLFDGAKALSDASALQLVVPSSKSVYRNMFRGCEHLTSAPSLDFNALTEYCYSGMFEGCSSLEETQVLKSTELAEGCYFRMYKDCRSLDRISVLPADVLAENCYGRMFEGCSLLKVYSSKPEGDAANMLLLGETDAAGALAGIFDKTGGDCFGTPLTGTSYWIGNEVMYFADPESVSIVRIPAGLETGDSMRLRAKVLPAGARIDVAWQSDLPSVVSVDASGRITCVSEGSATITATASGSAPSAECQIVSGAPSVRKALEFSSDSVFSIEAAGGKAWDGDLEYAFAWPSGEWNVWDGSRLDSVSGSDGMYRILVRGVGNTRIGALSSSGKEDAEGRWTISGDSVSCSGDIRYLLDYADIENAKASDYCFNHLFDGCVCLASPPVLDRVTLSAGCFSGMFAGCASLSQAPALPSDGFKDGCFAGMFKGCSLLKFSSARDGEYSNAFLSVRSAESGAFAGMFDATGGELISDLSDGAEVWSANFLSASSPVEAEEVFIDPDSVALEVSQKKMLVHSVTPDSATNQLVVWSSNMPSVASVDSKGMVTAVSNGEADITATIDGGSASATCHVSVVKTQYVEFSSPNQFQIRTANSQKNWDGVLEFKTADNDWAAWDGTSSISAEKGEGDSKFRLRMRGSGNTEITSYLGSSDVPEKRWVISGSNVECKGDLSNLLECDDAKSKSMAHSCFAGMFYGCDALISAPSLNMMELSDSCYREMFENCTNLMIAPELPATNLKDACYMRMFRGCSSLVLSPQRLPATSAEGCCYKMMFADCVSLVNGPEFTISGSSADEVQICMSMFKGCVSLRNIRADLPAVSLGEKSYYEMFSGCVSLEDCPDIGVTSLGSECMYRMFYGCKSLKTGPKALLAKSLPAGVNNIAISRMGVYQEMFSGCSSLETPPAIHATNLGSYCFAYMFKDCVALEALPAIPADKFPSGTSYSCYGMFEGCSSVGLSRYRNIGFSNGFRIPKMESGQASLTARMFYGTTGALSSDTASYHNATFYASNRIIWPLALDGFSVDGDVSEMEVGSQTLLRIVPDKYGMDPAVTWSAEPASVAEVDSSGCVTALSEGNVTVTATSPIGKTGAFEITVKPAQGVNALCFSSAGQFALKANGGRQWDGIIEYSTSYPAAFWTVWQGERIEAEESAGKYRIYLRGYGNHYLTGQSESDENRWVIEGSEVRLDGRIRNILDYANPDSKPMVENACANLFNGCTALVSAPIMTENDIEAGCYYNMFANCTSLKELPENILPVTTLNTDFSGNGRKGCYEGMFRGCSSLTTAPSLPATVLAERCYKSMFEGCSSLAAAPSLGATELSYACYEGMFKGCSSLTDIPELPAKTLVGDYYAGGCYASMFEDCTGLVQVSDSKFKATELAQKCYESMFKGCTSLTGAPSLGIRTLKADCYKEMFEGCISLITAPALPATSISSSCYEGMFRGCTSLQTAPELPATKLYPCCYEYMFEGCSSLVSAPELKASALSSLCYGSMFKGCTSLTSIPRLRATKLASYCYESMFEDCTGLTSIPRTALPAVSFVNRESGADADSEEYVGCYYSMFSGCSSLKLPADFSLPAETLSEGCYMAMFKNCISLDSVPAKLLSKAKSVPEQAYMGMFDGCESLVLPEGFSLPATDVGGWAYSNMFRYCKSLVRLPSSFSLPAEQMTDLCYAAMFQGCSSLESGPALPSVKLASYCYYGMFDMCSSLKTAMALPAANLEKGCYAAMFARCTSLESIPRLSISSVATDCCNSMFYDCAKLQFSSVRDEQKAYVNEIVLPIVPNGAKNTYLDMFANTSGEFKATPFGGRSYWSKNEFSNDL